MTEAEYLAFERASPARHEFFDGEIYPVHGGPNTMMTGGTFHHSRIADSLSYALRSRLQGKPCQPISRDLRVKPLTGTSFFYPDVLVYCGKPQLMDKVSDTLTNPTIIFEVLSDSTEQWDRTGKFTQYRLFETLQEYVLVSQAAPLIEHYRRTPEGWLLTIHEGMTASLPLPAVQLSIPLAEIYDGIDFTPAIEDEAA